MKLKEIEGIRRRAEGLEIAGLRPSESKIISALSRVDNVTPQDIQDITGMSKSNIGITLSVLKEKGWVQVEPIQPGARRLVISRKFQSIEEIKEKMLAQMSERIGGI